MLINVSNHPHAKWSEKQSKTAKKLFGEVVDFPFPLISAAATSEDIDRLVDSAVDSIDAVENCKSVMVQGEYTYTFRLVRALKERGFHCYAAESARIAEESMDENGNPVKKSVFIFEQFLEY